MVKASMKYTLDDMRAYRKAVKSIADIIIIFSVIFVLDTVVMVISQINDWELYASIALSAAQVIIAALGVALVIYSVNKKADQRFYDRLIDKFGTNTVDFQFESSRFMVFYGGSVQKSMDYSSITKVIETREYFFITVSGFGDLVIRKSAVTEGGADELERILENNVTGKLILK